MRRQPAPGEEESSEEEEEEEEEEGEEGGREDGFAQLPEATKGLRACRKCRLIKEFQQVGLCVCVATGGSMALSAG